ncbi:MAG: hypothetical protein MJE77_47625 [Proteobacteria bacterium]|nr:hypothetical protein [Pseudomonadota bacterium]
MRLEIVENGHTPVQKKRLATVKAQIGSVPDPIRVFSYRRDLFGEYFAVCLHEAMRLSSEWRVGETELFAAFVSKQNQCNY